MVTNNNMAWCSRELSVAIKQHNSGLTKRQFVNSQFASFKQKRMKAWTQFNYRDPQNWKQLDKHIQRQKIMADLIRDRNHKDVYGDAKVIEDCNNLIKLLDQQPEVAPSQAV